MKYNNKPTKTKPSTLEGNCEKMIREYGLDYEYEPISFELMPGFKFPITSYQKYGKRYIDRQTVAGISYTPDFIIMKRYVLECKGFFTEPSRIRWKLFKRKILDENLDYELYMCHNKKQIKFALEDIISKEKARLEQEKPESDGLYSTP